MVKIYTLTHPTSTRIYIGKTISPLYRRLSGHLGEARGSAAITKKLNWIRGLIKGNLKPIITQITEVDDADWESAEKFYIALAWQLFPDGILNDAKYPGGDKGPVGHRNPKDLVVQRASKRRSLSQDTLEEIAEKINNGSFVKDMAKEYGVNRSTIHRGLSGIQMTGLNVTTKRNCHTGESAYQSKITLAIANEIRERYSTGKYRHCDLAKEYGVCKTMIGNVIRGQHWIDDSRKIEVKLWGRKLSNEQLQTIASRITEGELIKDLAKEYDVSTRLIWSNLKGNINGTEKIEYKSTASLDNLKYRRKVKEK